MQNVVIVGAGLAGHRAAAALRKNGYEGALAVVGGERHPPYDRPPLSKQLLGGTMERDAAFFPCDDLNARWMLGRPATALDADRQVVRVGEGTDSVEIGYDGLVLATGRGARGWPEPLHLDGFHTLRNIDDCAAFRRAALSGARVTIVGAGFIGCEVAATLRGHGVEQVTLIDVADHPMAPLGPEVGRRAARIHADHGVDMRLGTAVDGFEGSDGAVTGVRLGDGRVVGTDVVLLALGSSPSTGWLAGSGLALDGGNVVCDENLFAADVANVVVAGDVAAFPHPETGDPVRVEHWSNAREMAAVAAANLLADPEHRQRFAAVPTFWSDQYNLKIKSAGYLSAADSFLVVEEDPDRPSLVVEARREGRLVGAVTVNKNKKIIDYTRTLAEAVPA